MTASLGTVGIIGYGEVGSTFAVALANGGRSVRVASRSPDRLRADIDHPNIAVTPDPATLAEQSDAVLSCVWPGTAATVAAEAAAGLAETMYVDLNSVSPGTSHTLSETVQAANGYFINGSILGSVVRHGFGVPIAVSGPDLERVTPPLREAGFTIETWGTDPAHASVLKMCRSAVTKGMLALFVEALGPARQYGLDGAVLDSIDESFADMTPAEFARQFLPDMTAHGQRRSGELDEVIATIADEGFDTTMSERAREHSRQLATLQADDYEAVLDRLAED